MPSEYDFLLPYSRYSRSLRRTGRGWRMALLAGAFGAGVVSTTLIVALPLRPFTHDDGTSDKAGKSAANRTSGATSAQPEPPRPSRAVTPDTPAESTSSSPPKLAAKPAEPHAPTRTAMQAERAAPSITGADEPVPQPRPRPLALGKEQPAAPVESATASARSGREADCDALNRWRRGANGQRQAVGERARRGQPRRREGIGQRRNSAAEPQRRARPRGASPRQERAHHRSQIRAGGKTRGEDRREAGRGAVR